MDKKTEIVYEYKFESPREPDYVDWDGDCYWWRKPKDPNADYKFLVCKFNMDVDQGCIYQRQLREFREYLVESKKEENEFNNSIDQTLLTFIEHLQPNEAKLTALLTACRHIFVFSKKELLDSYHNNLVTADNSPKGVKDPFRPLRISNGVGEY